MAERLNLLQRAPEALRAVMTLERFSQRSLDEGLLNLVKLRASMLNKCVYCVDLHSRDALAVDEDPRRLFGLAGWARAPFYSDQERAALALTDAVTLIGEAGVSDEVWAEASAVFSEDELAALMIAIVTINVWNRLGIGLQTPPDA